MTLCLAQAYQSAGDFGTARQQLERLLSENARDSQLLGQLVALTEAEGDLAGAGNIRDNSSRSPRPRRRRRAWPNSCSAPATRRRPALVGSSCFGRARGPPRHASSRQPPLHARPESVVTITERLLREQPHNWEILYRRGVALADAEKPEEAARCFQSLLDCRVDDDEPSARPSSGPRTSPRPVAWPRPAPACRRLARRGTRA